MSVNPEYKKCLEEIKKLSTDVKEKLKLIYKKKFDLLAPHSGKSLVNQNQKTSLYKNFSDELKELFDDPDKYVNKILMEKIINLHEKADEFGVKLQRDMDGKKDALESEIKEMVEKVLEELENCAHDTVFGNTPAEQLLNDIDTLATKAHNIYMSIMTNMDTITQVVNTMCTSFCTDMDKIHLSIKKQDRSDIFNLPSEGDSSWWPCNDFSEGAYKQKGIENTEDYYQRTFEILNKKD